MSWVYPLKVPLFITFFIWKSQIEDLHWLSALAVWILRGGENVSKLVNIQELEENRLSCQSLLKIFPLGTLSHLTQVPKIFLKTLQGWHVFCCLCKTFLHLADYLYPQIPTSSTSCCDSAATVAEPMLHASHALATPAPWCCLVCCHPSEHLKV